MTIIRIENLDYKVLVTTTYYGNVIRAILGSDDLVVPFPEKNKSAEVYDASEDGPSKEGIRVFSHGVYDDTSIKGTGEWHLYDFNGKICALQTPREALGSLSFGLDCLSKFKISILGIQFPGEDPKEWDSLDIYYRRIPSPVVEKSTITYLGKSSMNYSKSQIINEEFN